MTDAHLGARKFGKHEVVFEQHPVQVITGGMQATKEFDNGWFVSIVAQIPSADKEGWDRRFLYGDGINTWEVGVRDLDDKLEVYDWCSGDEVTEALDTTEKGQYWNRKEEE